MLFHYSNFRSKWPFFLIIWIHCAVGFASASSSFDKFSREVHQQKLPQDSLQSLKQKAYSATSERDFDTANSTILAYIKASGDLDFIYQEEFVPLKDSLTFTNIMANYEPQLNIWTIICIIASIIGLFIAVILNLQYSFKSSANILIGCFVLFHSIFIAHVALYFSNYVYRLPHSLYISTTFSFLYGPLLYFYFKKTIQDYTFKARDLLHLLPSVVLLIYIFPYYTMDENSKLMVLLNNDKYILPGANVIVATKTISLFIYALFIHQLHKKHHSNNKEWFSWKKQLKQFFNIYVFAYLIYGLTLTQVFKVPYMLHALAILLASLVMYIAYIAFTKPNIIASPAPDMQPPNDPKADAYSNNEKYKKSGLTSGFSLELKNNLLHLLHQEKVFKANNLTLEILSKKLDTTRHNTSQVINEHFQMNFFELINHHRIEEAKKIFESEDAKNMHIIDIAYKVGYNNKVTFNKSFKKHTHLTPTQYIEEVKSKKKALLANIAINGEKGNIFPSGPSN